MQEKRFNKEHIWKTKKISPHNSKNLTDPNEYGKTYSSGYKRKLSKQVKRAIVRKESNSTKNLSQVKSRLKLDVHKTTIWKSLNRNPFIIYEHINKTPWSRLFQRQKGSQLEFASQNIWLGMTENR